MGMKKTVKILMVYLVQQFENCCLEFFEILVGQKVCVEIYGNEKNCQNIKGVFGK